MPEEPKDKNAATTPRRKKTKRVDAKHLKVARGVARGMTLREAGVAAGYPSKSAAQSAWKAMETIKRKAPAVFDEEGLTLKSLAQDVNRLRRAKETKFFSDKGCVIETREVEALHIQLEAVDMGLRVQGAYSKDEQQPSPQRHPQFVINLGFLDPDRAQEVLAGVTQRGADRGCLVLAADSDANAGRQGSGQPLQAIP
jgi:hypothetical protein